MDERDFLVGALIGGGIVTILIAFVIMANPSVDIKQAEKRAIELNMATYESGTIKYLDSNVKYILTGEK